MPKNVMKLLKPSPHRARNDFDLSHRHIFSANFGELLPISCIETVPGDHIKVHASDLLRAIPLVTSPFLRAKQHLDVWFVPYRDLWHNFDQFMVQKNEPVSSALKSHTFLPHTSLANFATALQMAGNDIVGRNFRDGAERLVNLLGYGSDLVTKFGNSSDSPSVNLFRLAAYNYIWYNEYRQQYYDDGMNLVPSVLPIDVDASAAASMLFNFDWLQCDTEGHSEVLSSYIRPMMQLRYRLWKKDLYTGLMPSTQFGSVSTVNVGNINVLNTIWLKNEATGFADYQNVVVGADGLARVSNSGASSVVSDSEKWRINASQQSTIKDFQVFGRFADSGNVPRFDVLALRRSEAVQIWRENALRAGNHVKDNMEAHYGVSSDFQDHRPRFLGSVSSPLNIGDVMATANSSTGVNDRVGDIAGKGLSSLDEKVFTYDAKEFGVIMCMFSILPETEYNAIGVDRMNQLLETEDFFIPEYENLGLEAVSSQNFNVLENASSKVVGYAPRYYGYKTKLDKVFGSFQSSWNGSTGINAPWASPNYPAQNAMAAPSVAVPIGTLYVNPAIFDVNFSFGVNVMEQFLCDVYFDVDAVRPMSVVGLPFS